MILLIKKLFSFIASDKELTDWNYRLYCSYQESLYQRLGD